MIVQTINVRDHVVCGSVIGLDAIVQAAVQAVMNGIESTKDDLGSEMQVMIAEDTGRLLSDFLMNLASGNKVASQVEYAAKIESLDHANWTKASTVPHAAKVISESSPQIAGMHLDNEGKKLGLNCHVE